MKYDEMLDSALAGTDEISLLELPHDDCDNDYCRYHSGTPDQ